MLVVGKIAMVRVKSVRLRQDWAGSLVLSSLCFVNGAESVQALEMAGPRVRSTDGYRWSYPWRIGSSINDITTKRGPVLRRKDRVNRNQEIRQRRRPHLIAGMIIGRPPQQRSVVQINIKNLDIGLHDPVLRDPDALVEI
jgi:hypothetical protein